MQTKCPHSSWDNTLLLKLNRLAKASVHGLQEPHQLRSSPLIDHIFSDREAQLFALLVWLHNGGLLQLTAKVDYHADEGLIIQQIIDQLTQHSAALKIGSVCPATRKVLLTLGLLFVDSCKRGSWPVETDQDYYLNAVQLQICAHGRPLVPVTTDWCRGMGHFIIADFGEFCKIVVFGLPLVKFEYQRHLTDIEQGTSPAHSSDEAGDGPPCKPARCNQSDLCDTNEEESAFLQAGGNEYSIIYGAQCSECGEVMPISPQLTQQQVMADGHPYYCPKCHTEVELVYSGQARTVAHYALAIQGHTPAETVCHFQTHNSKQIKMCEMGSKSIESEDALITAGSQLRSARQQMSSIKDEQPAEGSQSDVFEQWVAKSTEAQQSLELATETMARARDQNAKALQETMASVEEALKVHRAFMEKPIVGSNSNTVTGVTQVTPVTATPGITVTSPVRAKPSAVPLPMPKAMLLADPGNAEQTSDKAPTDVTPLEIVDSYSSTTLITRETMTAMQAVGGCLEGKQVFTLNMQGKMKDISKEMMPKLSKLTQVGNVYVSNMAKYHKELSMLAAYLRDLGLLELFEMMKNSPGRIIIVSDPGAYGQGESSAIAIQNLARERARMSVEDQCLVFGRDYLSFHGHLEESTAQRDENAYLVVAADRLQEREQVGIKAIINSISEEAKTSIENTSGHASWSIFDYVMHLLHFSRSENFTADNAKFGATRLAEKMPQNTTVTNWRHMRSVAERFYSRTNQGHPPDPTIAAARIRFDQGIKAQPWYDLYDRTVGARVADMTMDELFQSAEQAQRKYNRDKSASEDVQAALDGKPTGRGGRGGKGTGKGAKSSKGTGKSDSKVSGRGRGKGGRGSGAERGAENTGISKTEICRHYAKHKSCW